jgi:hypothetical protein
VFESEYPLTPHMVAGFCVLKNRECSPFDFATAVGIFFGVYPARNPAMLDPITTVRYEDPGQR